MISFSPVAIGPRGDASFIARGRGPLIPRILRTRGPRKPKTVPDPAKPSLGRAPIGENEVQGHETRTRAGGSRDHRGRDDLRVRPRGLWMGPRGRGGGVRG